MSNLEASWNLDLKKARFRRTKLFFCALKKADYSVATIIYTLIPSVSVKLKRISISNHPNKEIILLSVEEMFWRKHTARQY